MKTHRRHNNAGYTNSVMPVAWQTLPSLCFLEEEVHQGSSF